MAATLRRRLAMEAVGEDDDGVDSGTSVAIVTVAIVVGGESVEIVLVLLGKNSLFMIKGKMSEDNNDTAICVDAIEMFLIKDDHRQYATREWTKKRFVLDEE